MRFSRMSLVLTMGLAVLSAATRLPVAGAAGEGGQDAGLLLFFMGERQSQIEPCGCIAKKLGGVQFEARLYEGRARASSLRVDAGGFSSRLDHPEDSMRTRYALQAMAGELDLDAINVAARDLTLGAAWFADVTEHFPEIGDRLVSANIRNANAMDGEGAAEGGEAGTPAFLPFRLVERATAEGETVRVLITGAATARAHGNTPGLEGELEAAGWTLRPAVEAVGEVLASAPAHDLAIVLAATDRATASAIVAAHPEADIVITSAKPEPGSGETGRGANLLYLPGSEGKLLGRAQLTPRGEGAWSVAASEPLEVSPELEPAPALVELIDSYKRGTEEMMVRTPRRVDRVYAGARTCGTCHTAEHDDWKGTRHARALETLGAKGMQFDSRCLQCHTVGFARNNGFYNVRESMVMAGVQCESCHGPAAEHADLELYLKNRERFGDRPADFEEKRRRAAEIIPPRQVGEGTCVTCHTPENDDHFVYDVKVRRVNHTGRAAAVGAAGGEAAPPEARAAY